MRELDLLVGSFTHEKKRPREAEALHTLQKIASLVKPIMRARGWKVGTLAEFYPPQQNLLGVNWNKGSKICLRLRYPRDANQFLPLEQVVDTMLHELSHNVFGAHDAKFHALWDQLRDEYEGLRMKGYTGEGFLSEGKRLGGRSVPRDEARRIARNAAERRRTLSSGSGQKLGGAPVRAGVDIRDVIVSAIERRNTVLQGCGSGGKTMNDLEVKELADQATNNGFRTKAEEDKANEDAIAQALWELVQEDEKKKYGTAYVEPTAANPTGNGGGKIEPTSTAQKRPASFSPTKEAERRLSSKPFNQQDKQPPHYGDGLVQQQPLGSTSALQSRKPPIPFSTKPTSTSSSLDAEDRHSTTLSGKQDRQPPRHTSRLVQQQPSEPVAAKQVSLLSTNSAPTLKEASTTAIKVEDTYWECPICTFHNNMNFLCCDACTSERPESITRKHAARQFSKPLLPTDTKPETWTCHRCTTIMENKWWTCSTCGGLKASS